MATRLQDLIVPELWTPNFLLESAELTAFFNSGIVTRDTELDRLATGEGHTFHLRHLNDLANEEENISSDDPSAKATPSKITGGAQIAVKLMRNKLWSSMDLAAALHAPDPVAAIRSRVAAYWVKRYQAATVSILRGVLADNEANDGGDMVYDHTTSSASDKTISGEAIINATATMGDALSSLSVIAMHSMQYVQLQKRNLIQYLREGDADITFPVYLGRRVVVDDGLPVTGAGSHGDPFKYLAVLFAPGAVRMGFGAPKMPVEVDRDPKSGNGEGEETLASRSHFILHPAGFKYNSSQFNPNNAQLSQATSWDRVFERKQAAVAFVRTL